MIFSMDVAGEDGRVAVLRRRGFALEYVTLGWNVAGRPGPQRRARLVVGRPGRRVRAGLLRRPRGTRHQKRL